jgi:hypothetical protein
MKKIYLVGRVINTLLFFFIISNAWANRSLSGLIKDKSTGESLPGVSVSVKGTSLGAISDAGGAFKLQVSDNAVTLVFTSIGYVSQEVTVPANHSGQLLVELIEDAKNLSELIVVGYGTQTKTEFTGSAVQIKGDAIKG